MEDPAAGACGPKMQDLTYWGNLYSHGVHDACSVIRDVLLQPGAPVDLALVINRLTATIERELITGRGMKLGKVDGNDVH